MSHRSFFEKRYTFPGFTFIVIVSAINFREILHIFFVDFKSSIQIDMVVGIAISLLTIFSGERLGFFFAQIWHFFFPKWDKQFLEKHTLYCHLKEVYSVDEDLIPSTILYDYATTIVKDKSIESYFDRRYDMLNILGSTIISTIIGCFSGVLIKILYYFVYNPPIQHDITWIYEPILILGLIILIYFMSGNIKRIMKERCDMALFIIKNGISKIL